MDGPLQIRPAGSSLQPRLGRDWRATATNRRRMSRRSAAPARGVPLRAAAHTTCPLFDAVAQAAMAAVVEVRVMVVAPAELVLAMLVLQTLLLDGLDSQLAQSMAQSPF